MPGQVNRVLGLQEGLVVEPKNRKSAAPRSVDFLIDAFRIGCGLCVALVGGYHLAASFLGVPGDLGFQTDDIIMAPITASCLMLMGLSLLLIRRSDGSRWLGGLVMLCPGAVALASLLRFLEWLTPGHGFFTGDSSPSLPAWLLTMGAGPMGPWTALALLLASLTTLMRNAFGRLPKVDYIGLGGLLVAMVGGVFVLGNFYATLPFYQASSIPMAPGTGLGFSLLGLGLIATAGPKGALLRPVLGRSVKARLFRWFLPYAVLIVVGSDSLTLLAARFSSPSSSALTSAMSVATAATLAVAMCAFIASYIGDRLQRTSPSCGPPTSYSKQGSRTGHVISRSPEGNSRSRTWSSSSPPKSLRVPPRQLSGHTSSCKSPMRI